MDPLPSVQPPKIQSMMDAIDSKGYTRSKNIIERNKAAFLAELQPTSTTHLIQSKSIPVEIVDKNKGSDMSGNHPALSAENKNLIFHFYSVGSQADPSSYSMTITDPIDLFFHFTSQAITRDVFKSLTRNIDLVESAVETSSARFSMRSGTFGPISNGALNFHHAEKKGGIIGVYSNDFMSGVIEDPERLFRKLT